MLSDYESTRKYEGTKRYVDLCNLCFSVSGLTFAEVDDRVDLRGVVDEVESEEPIDFGDDDEYADR
jgi:hypothetical protein